MTSLRLDHIGCMLRDLATGAARWERLGFRLTPVSPQMGLVTSGEAMQPWATANRCAMFRTGYLELIGLHRPELFNPWARFMARFEGAHICALRCDEADAAYAMLAARSDGFAPPVQRQREALRFRNIFSRDTHFPEARFIVIEHQTPEEMWRADMLDHPNGATGLVAAIFCAEDVAATRKRLEVFGNNRLTVLDSAGLSARFPGVVPPPRPCIAGVTIAFDDPASAIQLMRSNGVTVQDDRWIVPADANGMVIEIVATEARA
jgi:hypothetical protein